MTNENDILSEADEIAALLPWYVTGKISAEDRARVEAYAAKNPAVRKQIEIAREEADSIFSDNAGIEPPRAALDKLMQTVAASPSARLHSAGTSIIDRIGEFLAGLAPRQLAYAALSAALALAVLAGGLGARLGGGGAGYEVATGPSASAGKGTYAHVALQVAAPAAALSAFLAENKFTIVEGPKAGGLYRVRLSEEALSDDATKAMIDKIKARTDLFTFAASAPPNT